LKRLQAGVGVEGFFEDELGRVGGDVFDVHAAFARGHQDRLAAGPVDDDAEVQLAGDIAAGLDEDLLDGSAGRARLDGDQFAAQQVASDRGGLFGRFDELDAVLVGVRFDGPFAASASVDLGFHHGDRATKFFESGSGFFGRTGDDSLRNCHVGVAEQLFRLKFVDLHRLTGLGLVAPRIGGMIRVREYSASGRLRSTGWVGK